ncbi:hypothetical protein J2W28_000999 [Variovorax boronicumulans]|uniref:hypothetical protein n=1 Tax=Variovorax boronicumulans TaxID=436515 RepID=UPI00278BA0BC|nr:hypothetical protein [Variovorax boronicumulans]MDP9991971.1 hypothetical protein [Variovorax boronicumulans]MDQ0001866.1 hypothetical protein [Variovorax boronicumulans]
MTTFAILATGPSMSKDIADAVRGRARVIAVSDAYRLAPWAEALVSNDKAWWAAHPDALAFAGRKFSGIKVPGCETMRRTPPLRSGSNSGLMACDLATQWGATQILLLGFDMQGSHFFGAHLEPLKNTAPERFAGFCAQFAKWKPLGVRVLNCTPGSALRCFPFTNLEAALC